MRGFWFLVGMFGFLLLSYFVAMFRVAMIEFEGRVVTAKLMSPVALLCSNLALVMAAVGFVWALFYFPWWQPILSLLVALILSRKIALKMAATRFSSIGMVAAWLAGNVFAAAVYNVAT